MNVITRIGNGEKIKAIIGHNEYVNEVIVRAAGTDTLVPAKTYVSTSGNIGWLQAKPNQNWEGATHTHITFVGADRNEGMKILNGND